MNYFGYLDAGTGAMVAQALIGAVIAVFVFIKGFGHRLRNLFRRGKPAADDTPKADKTK